VPKVDQPRRESIRQWLPLRRESLTIGQYFSWVPTSRPHRASPFPPHPPV
jgi:hypothetical protein